MGSIIKKIRLINYKRFEDYSIEPNDKINILIGDNEVGKSSVLEAIDLVAGGNIRRVENIGFEKLLNVNAVEMFMGGDKTFESLPILHIELYLQGEFDFTMNGKNNLDKKTCDGIRLVCAPNLDYREEIINAVNSYPDFFPYDYYLARFSTFADVGYTAYKKKIRSVLIDSTRMGSEYATNDFIQRMYTQYTECDVKERIQHKSKYRFMKKEFQKNSLGELNGRVPPEKNYSFGLKNSNAVEFENNLMIYENQIGIDSKGTGKQVFIKTDFALERAGDNVDVVLIEEPETHLSHTNLRKLIQIVDNTQEGQLFITTHNSLISARLELNNLLIMHSNGESKPVMLHDLKENTAKYFVKSPPASIVEYVLAQKVLLVEGPSEYMLLDLFYKNVTGHSAEEDGVHIIDVRGLSFKRYLDIAKLTKNRVAVLTDNDTDFQKHCIEKYLEYKDDNNIDVFYEPDDNKRTFEVVLYGDNKPLCDSLFKGDAQTYMLNNKTEAAFILLIQKDAITINVPDYIKRAIEWIKE